MKCFVSCVTYEPKFLPTIQCQVGLYFLSNSFLMYAAMSFSMLNFSIACVAHSTASCCISSVISAFFITAFLSVILSKNSFPQLLQIFATCSVPQLGLRLWALVHWLLRPGSAIPLARSLDVKPSYHWTRGCGSSMGRRNGKVHHSSCQYLL